MRGDSGQGGRRSSQAVHAPMMKAQGPDTLRKLALQQPTMQADLTAGQRWGYPIPRHGVTDPVLLCTGHPRSGATGGSAARTDT